MRPAIVNLANTTKAFTIVKQLSQDPEGLLKVTLKL